MHVCMHAYVVFCSSDFNSNETVAKTSAVNKFERSSMRNCVEKTMVVQGLNSKVFAEGGGGFEHHWDSMDVRSG